MMMMMMMMMMMKIKVKIINVTVITKKYMYNHYHELINQKSPWAVSCDTTKRRIGRSITLGTTATSTRN